jgi:cytochrome c oxidase cbb3-type subunit 3
MMKRTLYKSLFVLGGLLTGGSLLGQTETEMVNGVSSTTLMLTLVFTMIALGFVIMVLALTVMYLVKEKKAPQAVAEGEAAAVAGEKAPTRNWWGRTLGYDVALENEETILLHHDYDGIRELDNSLPPWWKWGFYFTIGFAVIYLFVYWFASDWSSTGEYQEEMAEAEIIKQEYLARVANLVNEENVTVLTAQADLNTGKGIYTTNCALCHGQMGEGVAGPNLTDQYWIHGGSINDVFSTIKYGVEAKGMRAWQDALKPQEMQQVASYIMSLQGTNPPNALDPQGELYVPAEEGTESDSTVTEVTEQTISMN